ncbi:MAG: biotin--[acetyl-CoA-carboxylase] ligase [Candidatus Nucleicultricaceae bacterium]
MKKFSFFGYFLTIFFLMPLWCCAEASLFQVSDDVKEMFTVRRAHSKQVDSTQTQAYQMLDDLMRGSSSRFQGIFGEGFSLPFADEILVLTADTQTSGIGSSSREWYSPIGGVYMTAIIPWPVDKIDLALHLSQVGNVSVCEMLEQYGFNPQIKWVNDTILGNSKCAGVLCRMFQNIPFKDKGSKKVSESFAIAVGIGINVNMEKDEAEQKYLETRDAFKVPYTSMHMVSGSTYDVESVLQAIMAQLTSNINLLLQRQDFQNDFLPKIKQRLAYVGQIVEYSNDTHAPKQVLFYGVNNSGEMISSDGTKSFGRIRPVSTNM